MDAEIAGNRSEMVRPFLGTDTGVKFVAEGNVVKLAFGGANEHIDLVVDPALFRGAGWVKDKAKTFEFGSNSCANDPRLLRDRPSDVNEADALLDEVRAAVTALLSNP